MHRCAGLAFRCVIVTFRRYDSVGVERATIRSGPEVKRMRFRIFALMVGVAIASVTVFGAAIPSSAQVVAPCNASTATFVQAVGFSRAPVLVPMSLPVTVCTLPGNVQVITPAFQFLGGRPGSIIVPSTVAVASCTSGFVATPSVSTVPVVQVFTVNGSTVVVLSNTTPLTVVTPLITCF